MHSAATPFSMSGVYYVSLGNSGAHARSTSA